jgi:hypothetical protein
MDEQPQRFIDRPDMWPADLAEYTARSRDALAKAREVLQESVSSDTFLGRQHYTIIPLPYQH